MGYPPQAIQSILRLSAQKRFEHAVKDIADAECLSCRRGEAFARTRGGAFQRAFGGRWLFQSAEDSGRLRRNLGETLRQGSA